jgi:putative MFS transporter
MWLINMPIALILIVVSPLLQESARFLQSMGRLDEARATLARFGISLRKRVGAEATPAFTPPRSPLSARELLGVTAALTLAALAWGFVNFGVMLWLPGSLVAEGRSMGVASALIARSTLIAVPTIALVTWLYSAWSTKRVLVLSIGVTTLGLVCVLLRDRSGFGALANPIFMLTLLIVGTSAVISILLPYAAESYPLRVRGRATGWVAGFSKAGGIAAQALGALALVPALGLAAGLVAIPSVLSMLLIAILGRDTKGRDLRELEAAERSGAFAAD